MRVYNILIRLYYFMLLVASLFNVKARKWIAGRRGWKQQFAKVDFSKQKWAWFHCSSFGEFQDGRNLMEVFNKKYPEVKILLTFFSPTGYELQKNYPIASAVFYLALDTENNAAWLLDTVKPQAAFFVRHDIWPNYLRACAKRNIPAFLVSFTLNANSTFFKWPLKGFYRNIFKLYRSVFVQYSDAEELLQQHRFSDRIVVTGNSRIDSIAQAGAQHWEHTQVEQFVAGSFCCIAGSTHKKDLQLFLDAVKQCGGQNIKWILVPHEIDQIEITDAQSDWGSEMAVLSSATSRIDPQIKLLWIDHVGMLAQLYRYADVAFIGGGFDRAGIHSILEPLVYGCAVCFGPNTRQYNEALYLLDRGTAKVIRTPGELTDFVMELKSDGRLLNKIKAEHINYISQCTGATQKVMDYINAKNYFA